jgi:hypothetical protein
MTDDNIVNLERRRNDLIEAEVEAEVKRIMDDLLRRDVGVVKLMAIAESFYVQCLAELARDEEALATLIKHARRNVREGALYFFAKRRLRERDE